MRYFLFSVTAALLITMSVSAAEEKADTDALAAQLRKLNGLVFPPGGDRAKQFPGMLSRSLHARLLESNRREAAAFEKVTTRAEWDRFRDVRINALRKSLGSFPPSGRNLKAHTTGAVERDRYRIDKLVFESRPGLVVTANLYRPASPPRSMPGLVLVHSFFHPKSQPELQDMGVNWA